MGTTRDNTMLGSLDCSFSDVTVLEAHADMEVPTIEEASWRTAVLKICPYSLGILHEEEINSNGANLLKRVCYCNIA